jgi:Porin PorA
VRKILMALLVGFGIFFLVLAGLLRFYAPSHAEKTPLDLDVVQVATGPAKVLNAGTGQLEDLSLNATRRVRTDSAASDSKVTVVQETLCVVKDVDNPPECVDAHDPQHRLVSFTTDRVAADRKTAQSTNDPQYATNIDGDTSATHTGLTYKWPFHAKKTSYKFFDPISRQAPDARYIGTEKLKGMTMYKYEAVIDKMDLPIGPGIPGSYADTRTVWVEPLTGAIVKGVEVQKRWLADGTPALDTTLTFNQAAIDYQAKQASDGRAQIKMLTVILPLVCLLVGLAALVGAFLLYRGTDGNGHRAGPGRVSMVKVTAPPR